MAKITEKIERKPLEIEGAILTTGILETIKEWQEDNNGYINGQINVVADCICYLAKTVYSENGKDEELKALFFDLSSLKDSLISFRKP
jgi:hypothetical protein